MFGLFNKRNKDVMTNTSKTSNHNTVPSWVTTEGSVNDVAMSIYQLLLKLDSSNQLLLRIESIPGFQFKIIKERI